MRARRHTLALVLLACVSCAACSAPSTPAPEADDPLLRSATGRAQTIRLEIPVAPDVADLPRLMARDALRQAGYRIEPQEFSDPTTTVQALIEGQLDFADLPFTQILGAS